jgi:hypothetical protein
VENILTETEKKVGTRQFYGEIWKAMLRTGRTRLSAIKYLEKRIPKDLEAARFVNISPSKYRMRILD